MTSAIVGGEWSTSRPGRFTPGERAPGAHWIGGWMDHPSIVQPVASRYTDYAIPTLLQGYLLKL
jgi:hypothetical protein